MNREYVQLKKEKIEVQANVFILKLHIRCYLITFITVIEIVDFAPAVVPNDINDCLGIQWPHIEIKTHILSCHVDGCRRSHVRHTEH